VRAEVAVKGVEAEQNVGPLTATIRGEQAYEGCTVVCHARLYTRGTAQGEELGRLVISSVAEWHGLDWHGHLGGVVWIAQVWIAQVWIAQVWIAQVWIAKDAKGSE
jgi:hypothetical protein